MKTDKAVSKDYIMDIIFSEKEYVKMKPNGESIKNYV